MRSSRYEKPAIFDKLFCVSDLQGAIAQLGERIVRNDEVVGSIPTSSTNLFTDLQTLEAILFTRNTPVYWTVMDRELSSSPLANCDNCRSAFLCDSGTHWA